MSLAWERAAEEEREHSRRPALALHVCCGPCATVVLERLVPRFRVRPVWYNPNITHPGEHARRLMAAAEACQRVGLPLTVLPRGEPSFLQMVRRLENEPEGGRRCELCFAVRMGAVAGWAARHGCSLVTTTLTVGPQKNPDQIHAVGRRAAQDAGIEWL
ncbi:MAG: epoxyqueuosine reductase QueH, partial [Armatimonadetes bacterium]|nr:epoxyqueuosine reductase QueH [Armatimonadota bacterium]